MIHLTRGPAAGVFRACSDLRRLIQLQLGFERAFVPLLILTAHNTFLQRRDDDHGRAMRGGRDEENRTPHLFLSPPKAAVTTGRHPCVKRNDLRAHQLRYMSAPYRVLCLSRVGRSCVWKRGNGGIDLYFFFSRTGFVA